MTSRLENLSMTSRLENLLEQHIRAYKLPKPERNYKGIKNRRLEFDFAWPAIKIAVEVQGGVWKKGGHTSGKGVTRDCEKMCLAQLEGWILLPVTGDHVKEGKAIDWIVEAMHIRK